MKSLQKNKIMLVLLSATIMIWGLQSCKSKAKKERPNILFITVDTMRWDHLGIFGKVDIDTPVMDKLAEGGVLFEDMIVSAPLTRISHASMFTGLYPPQHGVRDNVMASLSPKADTLAELLKNNGYATGAVISGFPVIAVSGLAQGFDYYDDTLLKEYYDNQGRQKVREVPEIKAEDVTKKAISWLREQASQDKPWFMWVHYYDPHALYEPPPPFDVIYKTRPYTGEVAYVDVNIGILLAELKKLGLREKTLIVLTSDHGEGLGEHDESTHSYLAYDSTIKVFAVLNWEGKIPAGKRISYQVRNIDLFPTVLEIAGIKTPKSIYAMSLVDYYNGNASGDLPAYTETLTFNQEFRWYPIYSIRDGKFHYIEAKQPELYDIKQDEKETNNLADIKVDEQKKLAVLLRKIIEEMKKGVRLESETVKLTESDLARLRALGYITSGSNPNLEEPGEYAKNLDIEVIKQLVGLQHRGLYYLQRRDFQNALATYLKMIEINRDVVEPYFQAGVCYKELGDFDSAMKYYLDYTARTSAFGKAKALVGEAEIYFIKGDYIESEKLLKEALKINPDYASAHVNLGMVYGQQEIVEQAESELRKALELDPKLASAYYGLGFTYAKDPRRQHAALENLYKALELEPDMAVAHLSIGSILGTNAELTNPQRALFHLGRALELDPHIPQAEEARKLIEELEKKTKK